MSTVALRPGVVMRSPPLASRSSRRFTGYCIGGGLATALNADIRFATPDSTFGIPAAKLGLGYGYDGLAKLARTVGPARARDIMFSARFLHAEEALRIGLVNFIESRETISDAVTDYARRVAGNAPLTVRAAKAAVEAWEAGERPEHLAKVRELVDACFNSEDYREGRRAFAEKRKPVFRAADETGCVDDGIPSNRNQPKKPLDPLAASGPTVGSSALSGALTRSDRTCTK